MALPLDPRLAARHAADAGAAPGHARSTRAREEQPGPDPARGAVRRPAGAGARRRQRLLRHGRRDAAVRRAPRRAARGGAWTREAVAALLPARRPGAGVDRAATATATATGSSSTSASPTAGSPTRAGRTPGTASPSPTAALAEAADRALRGAGLRLRRYLARARLADEAGDARRGRALASAGGAAASARSTRRSGCRTAATTRSALDGDKRPVDSLASNMGHCLWTGIVDEDGARQVAEHLLSPEMFSGWGVRTLADVHGRLQPAELPQRLGLAARQRADRRRADALRASSTQAQRITDGVLDAADAVGGRLPELFCGFDRDEFTDAGPLPDLVLAPGLGLGDAGAPGPDPAPLRPRRPGGEDLDGARWLRTRCCRCGSTACPLGSEEVTLDVAADGWDVDGLPEGLQLSGSRGRCRADAPTP